MATANTNTSDVHSDEEKTIKTFHHDLPDDPDAGLSAEERAKIDRKLLWKLDLTLIPWLCLLYLASFLDRTNIGNAKLDGLVADLHMTGPQYNACLTIFFISYSLAEPVTNVLIKSWGPRKFLTLTMVLWGICMTFMGFAKGFSSLMAARFFLGLTEAGLFPGINYYLSCWYKRSEFGIRAAIFFSAAAISGSFGGLLAAAISQMRGAGGKAGWAWIFILEGAITVVIGALCWFFVHDFPAEANFLSPEDKARVLRRLAEDKQSSAQHEDFNKSYVWEALKDSKTYLGMIIYMGADGALYAFSLFLPTIVQELGKYSQTHAQLLSVPPYVVACLVTVFIGFLADRTGQRGLCNIFMSLFGIMGFSMLLGSQNPHVKYAGTFLGAMGIYPCISNTISWVSNNVEGTYKRGVTLGLVIGWGNLNGVMSSNIYRAADKPRYLPGHAVVLGYLVVFLFGGSVANHFMLKRENSRRDAGKRDHRIEGLNDEGLHLLGDKRPDFRYVT